MKSRGEAADAKYDSYVEHPRFGCRPRLTGLNPDPSHPDVSLHWRATTGDELQRAFRKKLGELSAKDLSELGAFLRTRLTPLSAAEQLREDLAAQAEQSPRIAGTAVEADTTKQNRPTTPVTHYFDLERVCRCCSRPFIFFAEEQKHWYEVLGFRLEVDCVLCHPCRKREQSLAAKRAVYERLLKSKTRDWKENLQLAKCAVVLVEAGIFHHRVGERMRALLKTVPPEEQARPSYQNLLGRLKALAGQTPR